MVASTIITLASLPVYWILFHRLSTVGLVIASDIGIAANCCAMAILLHQRHLVSLGSLPWNEIGKALLTSVAAAAAAHFVAHYIPLHGSRLADLESLALMLLVWAGVVALGLWLLKSKLPHDLRRRKAPPVSATGNLPQ